ncbi:MAG: hypothetical protein Ct9H300mP16_18740 [Pseudomonadota bacterium]|nr:MAG: hypothetical protein Ct9H300mP16_18740 [Pseudomonadota bacterium]
MSPEDIQLYYQIGLISKRDLPLARVQRRVSRWLCYECSHFDQFLRKSLQVRQLTELIILRDPDRRLLQLLHYSTMTP